MTCVGVFIHFFIDKCRASFEPEMVGGVPPLYSGCTLIVGKRSLTYNSILALLKIILLIHFISFSVGQTSS